MANSLAVYHTSHIPDSPITSDTLSVMQGIPVPSVEMQPLADKSVQPLSLNTSEPSGSVTNLLPSSTPQPLESQFGRNLFTWLLAFVTGACLIAAIIYAWAVSVTNGKFTSLIPPSTSTALVILRVLSEASATLLAALIASTLETVVWASASSKRGITMSSFLGISASTGYLGLLSLLFWKTKETGADHHRIWVGNRYYIT